MAENHNMSLSGELDVQEHMFAIILEDIKLNVKKEASCIIQITYPPFGSREFKTASFPVMPDEKSKVKGGFWEHVLEERMQESDVKTLINIQPLCLKVYDQDIFLGNAKVDLNKLFHSDVKKNCNDHS